MEHKRDRKPSGKDGNRANTHTVFFGYGASKKYRFAFAIVPTAHDTVNIGAAICSPSDCFNKKIGREISHGRAVKNPTFVLKVADTTTIDGMLDVKNSVRSIIERRLNLVKDNCIIHTNELGIQSMHEYNRKMHVNNLLQCDYVSMHSVESSTNGE